MTAQNTSVMLTACRRVTPVISRLGDKWTVLVIAVLHHGPRRFNEIKRGVDGISQQMLTKTLKVLERDGMVSRTIFDTNPPQVQYALTPLGTSLSVPVLALGKWVHDHLDQIDQARSAYDGRDD